MIDTRCSLKKKKKKKKKKRQQKGAEVFKPPESTLTMPMSPRCAFPELSDLRAKRRPGGGCARAREPRAGGGRSGRAGSPVASSSAAAAAAPGPAAPGGPSRVTHGHERWEGVKCAFLLRRPGSDSHLLPRQVLMKQREKAPARRYTDNYGATHGRVSAEWPARGNGSARAARAGSRAARSRAQGHLTRWEPRPQPGARAGGAQLRPDGDPTAPGAQAAGASGPQRLSGRIVSSSSAILSCLRLPLPSPASRAPRDANSGRSPEEAGPPSPQPGTGFLSELCLSSSSSSSLTFQPQTPQPPPVIPLKPTWRRRQLPERVGDAESSPPPL